MAISSEKLTFTGADGAELAARLDLPAEAPRAYALFAHCFTCTKDIFAAARIASGLAEQGIAVLRFDFTGLGHSEGEFANTNFSSNVADLVCAADYLRETRAAPKVLIGHSLGGAAVLAAAPRVPEAVAVATIGAPADPAHVRHLFQAARPEIEAKGEAEVLLAGRPFRIRKTCCAPNRPGNRWTPSLPKKSNRAVQEQALRAAVNTTVQGTAADLMKLAMLAVDRVLLTRSRSPSVPSRLQQCCSQYRQAVLSA